jgi:hypothetical protein
MCDIVPGQIIFGRPAEGPGAEAGQRVLGRLFDDRAFNELAVRPEQEPADHVLTPEMLQFTLHADPPYVMQRMAVRPGREREAADAVREFAFEESLRVAAGHGWAAEQLARPAQRVIGQPVHYVHPLDDVATAAPFRLSDTHWRYLQALDIKAGSQASLKEPTLAVLDGGFAWSQIQGLQAPAGMVEPLTELVGPADAATAAVTHGTLVALIVASACPSARVLPIQVYGEAGTAAGKAATEWSLLHGLDVAVKARADVINISMGFGLEDQECEKCGTLPQASRSAALELVIRDAVGSTLKGPAVVGAAGNNGFGIFDFPARFENSVAISSVNSLGEPSSFTNFDHAVMHPWHFAAPGGDDRGIRTEWVAESHDHRYWGTSYAAAYAAALVAQTIGQTGQTATGALDTIADAANSSFPGYDRRYHGKGIIRSA